MASTVMARRDEINLPERQDIFKLPNRSSRLDIHGVLNLKSNNDFDSVSAPSDRFPSDMYVTLALSNHRRTGPEQPPVSCP